MAPEPISTTKSRDYEVCEELNLLKLLVSLKYAFNCTFLTYYDFDINFIVFIVCICVYSVLVLSCVYVEDLR
jgi:hypothetical protein